MSGPTRPPADPPTVGRFSIARPPADRSSSGRSSGDRSSSGSSTSDRAPSDRAASRRPSFRRPSSRRPAVGVMPGGSTHRPPRQEGPARGPAPWLLEILLGVAFVLASFPLGVLIDHHTWFGASFAAAVAVCGVGAVLRSIRVPAALVPLGQLIAVVVLVVASAGALGALAASSSPRFTGAVVDVIIHGIDEIGEGIAPMRLEAPGTVVLVLVTALVVLGLDMLMLGLGRHTETAIVLMLFMLVPALNAPDGGPWWSVAGPVLGGLLVLAARGVEDDRTPVSPPPRHSANRPSSRAATALATSLVLTVLASITAAAMPVVSNPVFRVDLDTLNAWAGRSTSGFGPQMIDDDISVRRGLMQGPETEILRVNSDAVDPGYIRLRTLTRFDGQNFSAAPAGDDEMRPAVSDLRVADEAPVGGDRYEFTISDLRSNRLPVPQGPVRWTDAMSQQPMSSILRTGGEINLGGQQNLTGEKYTVVTDPQTVTPDQLRAVTEHEMEAPYRDGYLPREQVPDQVERLAQRLAARANADNAYDAAKAYENYFHGFEYSLTVRSRPGEDPLAGFLRDKVGYCEQFAATFALMMNAQGYPTRVAIGFTSGTPDADGVRVITNHNAHAWPEVYFGPDHGWVRFEPTPAAAANGVGENEHVSLSQDSGSADSATSDEPTFPEQTQTSTTEDQPSDQESSTTAAPSSKEESSAAATSRAKGDVGWTGELIAGIVVIAVLVALLGWLWLAGRRRVRAREEAWSQVRRSGDDGLGASSPEIDPAREETVRRFDGDLAVREETVRRAAGDLAFREVHEAVDRRRRHLRVLGWFRLRPKNTLDLHLDRTLPPTVALNGLLDQIEQAWHEAEESQYLAERDRGRRWQVTAEHRAAADRIGEAVTDSRYAPPVTVAAAGGGRGAAPAPAPGPAAGDEAAFAASAGGGSTSARPTGGGSTSIRPTGGGSTSAPPAEGEPSSVPPAGGGPASVSPAEGRLIWAQGTGGAEPEPESAPADDARPVLVHDRFRRDSDLLITLVRHV